jgi:molybdopterin-containing oxidoreductase family iron-sulfur binding subunit
METSRRHFLKIAGISALGIGVSSPLIKAIASSDGGHAPAAAQIVTGENALKAKQWAMVIDTRKFESADALTPIIEACHKIHNVPDLAEVQKRHEIKWIWKEEYKHIFSDQEIRFPSDHLKKVPLLVLCNHCENPSCVRACPTKATFKNENGIVMMDFHRCIGCRFCMAACPYGSRSFNFRDPRPFIKEQNPKFPTRMKGVVEKCNFCNERLLIGQKPACVEASNGAIAFGDLEDPNSEVRQLMKSNYTVRRKPGLGTSPAVYYII